MEKNDIKEEKSVDYGPQQAPQSGLNIIQAANGFVVSRASERFVFKTYSELEEHLRHIYVECITKEVLNGCFD